MSQRQYASQRLLDCLKTAAIALLRERDFQLRMHQKSFVGRNAGAFLGQSPAFGAAEPRDRKGTQGKGGKGKEKRETGKRREGREAKETKFHIRTSIFQLSAVLAIKHKLK